MSDGPRKRRRGEGSIYQLGQTQYWTGAYISRRDGKRRYVCGWDWREVEARLDAAVALSKRQRSTDRLMMHTRRARAEDYAERIIRTGKMEGWSPDHTARVIVAQLSVRRIRGDIFGPCAYCGTWIAGTIDHVVPQHRGGTNDPSNLVSCCFSCNSKKGHRTPEEWAA